jgi:glutamine synthetase
VFQAWGYNNRTLMCRLPMNRRCLEVRTADSAVNFYLGSALVLAAGLDGIRRELKPGDPVNTDTYKMTPADLAAAGVRRLPWTLGGRSAFEQTSSPARCSAADCTSRTRSCGQPNGRVQPW